MQPSREVLGPGASGAASFEDCLRRQAELCLDLERLADSLPARIDTLAATELARRLLVTLRRCHRLEETIVFPVLASAHSDMDLILDRLRREHLEDEGHACDLQESIEAFVTRSARRSGDELGYMLRCLFVSLGRHLAFDRDYLLPLYRARGGT